MIAVLFARRDSVYKTIPGCDVYDIDRDARTFDGSYPVIGHPPCRAWGQLSHMAKPRPDEKSLAFFAVAKIQQNGGVLEHPKMSKLWAAAGLPEPGDTDEFGGWTLPINQNWFGHRAEKSTRLYIVGCNRKDIPNLPLSLGYATRTVESMGVREREKTPTDLAKWLVDLAGRCAK